MKVVTRQVWDKSEREGNQASNPQGRPHLSNTEAHTKVGSSSALTLRSCSRMPRWDGLSSLSTGAAQSALFLTWSTSAKPPHSQLHVLTWGGLISKLDGLRGWFISAKAGYQILWSGLNYFYVKAVILLLQVVVMFECPNLCRFGLPCPLKRSLITTPVYKSRRPSCWEQLRGLRLHRST